MASAEIASMPPSQSVTHSRASIHMTTPAVSAIRRKPKITYQSPSVHYNPPGLRIEAPALSFSRAMAVKAGSTSSSSDSNPSIRKKKRKAKKTEDEGVQKKLAVERPKYPMGPPLPLYHPLGRLALSLPELDPATLGLPPLPIDGSRRSSARTRRPAAKLREADDEASSTVPAVPAVTATTLEVRDKPSPKRKGGARPGAGVKRKRRDLDEDATYPAKKTRNPRSGPAVSARIPTSEAPSPPEIVPPPATPETSLDTQDEKKPERRSTRSRGSLLRRGSSASEATATSVSVSNVANATIAGKARSDDATELDVPSVVEGVKVNGDLAVKEAESKEDDDRDDGMVDQETKE